MEQGAAAIKKGHLAYFICAGLELLILIFAIAFIYVHIFQASELNENMSKNVHQISRDGLVSQVFIGLSLFIIFSLIAKAIYVYKTSELAKTTLQEEFLLQIQKDVESIFNLSPDLMCIVNLNGFFKRVSPSFTRVFGYCQKKMLAKTFIDFVHPEDLCSVREELDKLVGGNLYLQFENRFRTETDQYRTVAWIFQLDLSTASYYGFGRDVTEFKAVENRNKQILAAISDVAIIAFTDASGIIEHANDNFCKVSGYTEAELIGRSHQIVNSGAHSKEFFTNLWQKISSGQTWIGDIENKAKDGSHYFVKSVISPLRDAQAAIDQYIAIRFDVTEKILAMRRLEETQKIAKIGSWAVNFVSKEVAWSGQMYSMFFLDSLKDPPLFNELIAKIHPDDRKLWQDAIAAEYADGQEFKIRFRTCHGDKILWLESIGYAKRNEDGKLTSFFGTCQDITQAALAEELLLLERSKSIHNSKLASLGEMSAGIAHEINNPLAIILAITRVLPKFFGDQDLLFNKVEAMTQAGERIAKIVKGLRKFSRSVEQSDYQPHDLAEIINESLVLMAGKSAKDEVQIEIEEFQATMVLCDEIEIEQVLINLLSNAIDAVKASKERWIKIRLWREGPVALLQIRDSGLGIPEAQRSKLFQPFFTTKPVGEGTGLGLSIVKGILDQHHASIEIIAADPHTCFEIKFPLLLV